MIIYGFPKTKEIAKSVARLLKAEFSLIKPDNFPDGESHIKLQKNPQSKHAVIIHSLSHEPNKFLIEAILAGGAAKDNGAKKVTLVATYLPYMRQDKNFENYDSASAHYIVPLLKNFDEILAIDPHLHRIPHLKNLAKNCREITANSLIEEYIKKRFAKDYTLVGPDSESRQWDKEIADKLKMKSVILSKTRHSSEKVSIREKTLGDRVLIIDDIISTGHTILETIKMAKRQGAKKIACIGIHGVFVNGADKKITSQAELITTNTIPNKYAKIDVSSLIADELRKTN